MEEIVLKDIRKENCTVSYDFSVSEGLSPFFSGKPFVIQYPESIISVPDAVLAIPFVANILPLVWLANAMLRIEELDQTFYDCIPHLRGGFEEMFPESTFAGEIVVGRLVKAEPADKNGSAVFFSGGLDAVHTLVRHLEETPALVSIWGSDIRFENLDGWKTVHRGIAEYASRYSLPDVTIRSAFREFDNEEALDKVFLERLQDTWWHGVKHGIGLLGHVAPYVYLHGITTVYIASSNCPADGHVRCSSNPITDNHVRFVNARVIHDGFESSRQDKVRQVVDYVDQTGISVSLHVCWLSQAGSNCCRCEKCYRTMVALIAEGADPADYGFEETRKTLPNLRNYIVRYCRNDILLQKHWTHIQKSILEHFSEVKKSPYWKHIRWIIKADFQHPETLKGPINLREKLSHYKFYQVLRSIKRKLSRK